MFILTVPYFQLDGLEPDPVRTAERTVPTGVCRAVAHLAQVRRRALVEAVPPELTHHSPLLPAVLERLPRSQHSPSERCSVERSASADRHIEYGVCGESQRLLAVEDVGCVSALASGHNSRQFALRYRGRMKKYVAFQHFHEETQRTDIN